MTTVTVDANTHLWRINFELPYSGAEVITGYGETILTDPAGKLIKAAGGHATLPMSAPVARNIDDVAEETVDTAQGAISMATIMEALPLFFQRWRAEDEAAPPPGPPTSR